MSTVRREIVVPVSAEELWDAITVPDALREWFGADVDWELTPGGIGRFDEDDGTRREARVGAVEPGRHLGFTWWPEGREDEVSEVDYELEEADGGTRLVITETRAQLAVDAWDFRVMGLWCRAAASAVVPLTA